jgi:hypothetical protein
VYTSKELLADAAFCAVADADIDALRVRHGAMVVA